MASTTQSDDANDCRGTGTRENVSCPLFARRLYSNPLFVPHYVIEFQPKDRSGSDAVNRQTILVGEP